MDNKMIVLKQELVQFVTDFRQWLKAVFDFAKEAVIVTDISVFCKITGLVEHNSTIYLKRVRYIVFSGKTLKRAVLTG